MIKKTHRIKRSVAVLLALAIVFACAPGAAFAAPSDEAVKAKVTLDGTNVKAKIAPVLIGKDVLVSKETLTDYLGATASYKSSSKTLTVTTTSHKFSFKLNSKDYKIDGSKKTMSTAFQLVNKKPMVPIKPIVQGLGGKYSLKGKTAKVTYFSAIKGSVKITGSTTVQPIAQATADKLMKKNKGLSISVAGGGSGAGVNDTIAGTNNLGMSSRDLTASEASKIKALRIARDGIAIIVHPKNTVKKLTKEQAQKIFLGEITNWSEVGGNSAPIIVMSREVGSGTRTTLEEMLLDKKSVTSKATLFSSSALIKKNVAKSKNSIGFDSIGFVDSTVKALAIDNVKPSVETIKNRSYLMGRDLYLLSKGTPVRTSAMFVDYIKSKAGQDIVEKEGYIRLR